MYALVVVYMFVKLSNVAKMNMFKFDILNNFKLKNINKMNIKQTTQTMKKIFKKFERINAKTLLFSYDNQVSAKHVSMYIKCSSINKNIITIAQKFVYTKQQHIISVVSINRINIEKVEKHVMSSNKHKIKINCSHIKSKKKRFEYKIIINA